ncbi:hypothetical protein THICB2_690061 [Thiomonas sp. CB2]|nr:hypothetical protein THICB2_690061 [Thiomonas sp. CB2]
MTWPHLDFPIYSRDSRYESTPRLRAPGSRCSHCAGHAGRGALAAAQGVCPLSAVHSAAHGLSGRVDFFAFRHQPDPLECSACRACRVGLRGAQRPCRAGFCRPAYLAGFAPGAALRPRPACCGDQPLAGYAVGAVDVSRRWALRRYPFGVRFGAAVLVCGRIRSGVCPAARRDVASRFSPNTLTQAPLHAWFHASPS